MKLSVLFVQALFAGSALALPSSRERFERRVSAHNSRILPSQPIVSRIANSTNLNAAAVAIYDATWAGGVISSSAGTYKSVTGTLVVPTLVVPPGSSSSGNYAVTTWVGIDGATCQQAIWQAGVDLYIENGALTFYPWYEWYPAGAVFYDNLPIKAGDSITVTVTATSTTKGTVTIENNTTGESVSSSVTGPAALCEQDAEWIVEDFFYGDSVTHLADWQSLTWSGAVAKTSSSSAGPSSGYTMDLEQNGKILSSTSLSSSAVTIKYV